MRADKRKKIASSYQQITVEHFDDLVGVKDQSWNINLSILKPLTMKFLDPMSAEGEEVVELDTQVVFMNEKIPKQISKRRNKKVLTLEKHGR